MWQYFLASEMANWDHSAYKRQNDIMSQQVRSPHQPSANSTPVSTSLLQPYFEINLNCRLLFQNAFFFLSFLPGRSTKCSQREAWKVPDFSLGLVRQASASRSWSKDGITVHWCGCVLSLWSTLIHSSSKKAYQCLLNARLYRATRRPMKIEVKIELNYSYVRCYYWGKLNLRACWNSLDYFSTSCEDKVFFKIKTLKQPQKLHFSFKNFTT